MYKPRCFAIYGPSSCSHLMYHLVSPRGLRAAFITSLPRKHSRRIYRVFPREQFEIFTVFYPCRHLIVFTALSPRGVGELIRSQKEGINARDPGALLAGAIYKFVLLRMLLISHAAICALALLAYTFLLAIRIICNTHCYIYTLIIKRRARTGVRGSTSTLKKQICYKAV